MKKITIDLSEEGLDRLIEEIESASFGEGLGDRVASELSKSAAERAQAAFNGAVYDGDNDVRVKAEKRSEGCWAVVADGDASLFIEFGTGVVYPDDHPMKPPGVDARGTYGKGYGVHKTWGYYGNPGTNGEPSAMRRKGQVVLTHGNPANKCMYEARKDVEERLIEKLREVAQR